MRIQGRKKLIAFSMLAALIALPGCKSGDGEKGAEPQGERVTQEEKKNVVLVPSFSALFSERVMEGNRSIHASGTYFSGTLEISDQSGQAIDGSPFSVMILLDESNQTATLNQTFALSPGSYKGKVNVQGNGHQYIGDTAFQVQEGAVTDINLPLHPVIGTNSVNISNMVDLNRVRFQYPVTQLSRFTDPKLGVSINGSAQEIYMINQQDSSADEFRYTEGYVDLESGSNKIELTFFDGQSQVGKSHPDQETKLVYPGESLQMDIVPLEGKLNFNLPFEGADGTVSVQLPNQVRDISADQLSVRVSLIQNNTVKSQAQVSATGSYNNFQANLTLPELYYGNYTLLMELFEKSTQLKLGECSTVTQLENVATSTACNLRIHRSDITSSGNLLASVHVTVQDENGFPVNGALVLLDRITKTTSGGNDSSADVTGYGHFYQKPGAYTITAVLNDQEVTQEITLQALQSKNLFLRLIKPQVLTKTKSRLALGVNHSCFLKENGTVKCWGTGREGQLGDGSNDIMSLTPKTVIGIDNAISISAKENTTCALLSDKTVKCWGVGNNGQLGNGVYGVSNVPVSVSGLSNVQSIDVGAHHVCAVLEDKTLSCWGYNSFGALGTGTVWVNYTTPQAVPGLSDVVSVNAKNSGTCALLESGSISCMGIGVPVVLDSSSDSTSDTERHSPTLYAEVDNVAQIASGYRSTFLLQKDGSALSWGDGSNYILGTGNSDRQYAPVEALSGLSAAQQIAVGYYHGCAILTGQSVYCWGGNNYGQLGNGSFSEPVSVTYRVLNLDNVLEVEAGMNHTCAWLGGDEVRCWGYAWRGQLGDGSYYINESNKGHKAYPVRVEGL